MLKSDKLTSPPFEAKQDASSWKTMEKGHVKNGVKALDRQTSLLMAVGCRQVCGGVHRHL